MTDEYYFLWQMLFWSTDDMYWITKEEGRMFAAAFQFGTDDCLYGESFMVHSGD